MKRNISLFVAIALGIAISSSSIMLQEKKIANQSKSVTTLSSNTTTVVAENKSEQDGLIESKKAAVSRVESAAVALEASTVPVKAVTDSPSTKTESKNLVNAIAKTDIPVTAVIKPKKPILSRGGTPPTRKSTVLNSVTKDTSSEGEVAKSTSGKKVEVLDWWSSASKVFSRGSIATVKDVYTGKTFKIKRTMGTNHADCEALTSKDTEIIKSIWGGFSWDIRPIHIYIDGRILAASMSAMPHAGVDDAPAFATVSNRSEDYGRGQNLDVIKDNGMDGHFDVHFLNSTTHKDGKENPKHQAAIKIAAKS